MINLNKFGNLLRQLRERAGKSMQEAALELKVSRSYLSKVETGHERPSKEFLNKAKAIYAPGSDDFTQLFELSGYQEKLEHSTRKEGLESMDKVQPEAGSRNEIQIEIPQDMDVLYSDSVLITSSPYGVILTFTQTGTVPNKQKAIARIGMSQIHGKALVNALRDNLEKSERVIPVKNAVS